MGLQTAQNFITDGSNPNLNTPNLNSVYDHNNNFYNHAPASYIKEKIGDEIWDSYYKFCFERNPWDKVVSLYYFDPYGARKKTSFEDYASSARTENTKNYHLYTDSQNSVIVDDVFKYEELNEAMENLLKKLGLKPDLKLSDIKAKGMYRPTNRKSYKGLYNENTKERIKKLFSNEIAMHGYTFLICINLTQVHVYILPD